MTSVTPPVGWTDDEDCLYTTYYWSDKANTVRGGLEKSYNLSDIAPLWTCDPDRGEVLFILQGSNSKKELHYYLWNGLEDTMTQFVENSLENIKNEINSGSGSLKDVKFKDVE